MSSSPASSSANALTGSAVIRIKDFMFMTPGSVPAGSTVTVKNEDSTSHTVTATADAGFKVTVAGSSTGTFTAPAKAGDYPFVCTFHGNMQAHLNVV
jgi:plastocyanin